jgi:hypothetical protein
MILGRGGVDDDGNASKRRGRGWWCHEGGGSWGGRVMGEEEARGSEVTGEGGEG